MHLWLVLWRTIQKTPPIKHVFTRQKQLGVKWALERNPKINKKDVSKLIKITKDECDWLVSKGAVWHDDVHRTYAKHKTYYMTESTKMMGLLAELRADVKKETHS